MLHKSSPLVPNPSDINPVHTFCPVYFRLIFILRLCLAIPMVSFIQVYLLKFCMYILFLPCVPHVLPISSFFIFITLKYLQGIQLIKPFSTLSSPTQLILCSSVNLRNQVPHPYEGTDKMYFCMS